MTSYQSRASWERSLVFARAALATACLAGQFWWGRTAGPWPLLLVVAFALYSYGVLVFWRARRRGGELLGLIADTIFLLAFIEFGADPDFWISSAFYAYLLLSAVMLHQWWDVWIVAGLCAGLLTVARPEAREALWRLVCGVGLLACIFAVENRRTERRLAGSVREAESLRLAAEQARESERRRIAGDFHDGPLQSFISLGLRLEAMRKILARDFQAGIEELRGIQEALQAQIRELRAFVRGIRGVGTEGDSLAAALWRVTADFEKESGVALTFQGGESISVPADETSFEVVQIVREALHNVRKHSGATQAALTVSQPAGFLEFWIEDNGRGFDFSGTYDLEELDLLRMGPSSIKRRVRNLSGQLVVESRPGRGASLRVRVPI